MSEMSLYLGPTAAATTTTTTASDADSGSAQETQSAFHPLSFGSSYYGPGTGSAFQPTPSTSGYLDDRKFMTLSNGSLLVSSSVVNPIAGSSRQMHHLQPAAADTSEPPETVGEFIEAYFVDEQAHNDIVIDSMDQLSDPERKTVYDIEEERRMRHAEASRLRYHRLAPEQKREVNARRAERIKKQRQREREMIELENILRNTNDIEDDPEMQEMLRLRRVKLRRAEAARSRYHRMSEEERRSYNQRRRLKQMGLDPDQPVHDEDRVRQRVKEMNAKKAAAARARYHAMTDAERRDYNARRTAAFRKRRMEEESLLSTPAGKISAQALERAQKIMIRNAKKAESARLRYQRMSQDERRDYNHRRALAKKSRRGTPGPNDISDMSITSMTSHDLSMSVSDGHISPGELDDSHILDPVTIEPFVLEQEPCTSSSTPKPPSILTPLMPASSMACGTSLGRTIASIVDSPLLDNETLREMEKEVETRRRQAQAQLEERLAAAASAAAQHHQVRQQQQHPVQQQHTQLQLVRSEGREEKTYLIQQQPQPETPMIVYVTTEQVIDATGKETIYLQPAHGQLIDEKQLQVMLSTGRDERGHPVEIRTLEGAVLTPHLRPEELAAQQQHTVAPPTHHVLETMVAPKGTPYETVETVAGMSYVDQVVSAMSPNDELRSHEDLSVHIKSEVSRRRRAERARERYHNMTPEERSAFNSRRAEALRKARRRDEELVQLAEQTPLSAMDDDTKRAVLDAQRRRQRRAQLAREKYHRMNSEERRQYNAMRDAQRRQRKREIEGRLMDVKQAGERDEGLGMDDGDSRTIEHVDVVDGNDQDSSHGSMFGSYELFPQEY